MQLHPEQHCDPGGPQPIPTGASCARFLIFPCDSVLLGVPRVNGVDPLYVELLFTSGLTSLP